MTRRPLAVFVVIAIESLALTSGNFAYAQSPPPNASAPSSENRALAETLFFAGRGLMDAKRYKDACVKLTESYRLDPAAGTLLNLAVCHEQEGKVASAWGEYRQALSDARRAGRQDREDLTLDHLKALEPELPMLSINVAADARVPGLEVLRNGVPLSSGAWATELPVDPGTVEIIARAPGFKPRTMTVSIERKQHLSATVERLAPAPIDLSARPPQSFWTGRRTAGVVLAGVGLAALGVGAGFGANAISQRSKSDEQCPLFDGERRCSAAGVDAMSQARTSAWISDIGLGVGILSAAAGAYFLFTGGAASDDAAHATSAPRWRLRIDTGASGGTGTLTHVF